MERLVYKCPVCNREYSIGAAESVNGKCEDCDVDLVEGD